MFLNINIIGLMKRIYYNIFAALIIICFSISHSFAKTIKSDEATISLIVGEYKDDGNIVAGLHYKLEKGWKIYWRTAGDTGFPPQVDWESSQNISSMDMLWSVPKRSRYELLENVSTESYEYEDEVLFPLYFKAADNSKDSAINLKIYYAICKDICIPANVDINATASVGHKSEENLKLIEKFEELVPKQSPYNGVDIVSAGLGADKSGNNYLQVAVNSSVHDIDKSDIFIESDEDITFFAPQSNILNNKHVVFNINYKSLSSDATINKGKYRITIASGTNSVEKTFDASDFGIAKEIAPSGKSKAAYSTLIILLFAFIGGLILNIMPCVLPVLSIKLISIIKHGGGEKAHISSSLLTTAVGIITSFLVLGLFVFTLRTVGVNVGWGFHFQEPLFIITLIIILSLFAANMWGFYEFRLPSFLSDNISKKGEGESLTAHFFTGVFATILATPCTAPFLGTAVGFALGGSAINIFGVFLMMGVGMSTPYLILSIFPKAIAGLPKPGYWMVVVKYIMGCFIALTALWLGWVLSKQLGTISAILLLAVTISLLIFLHSREKIKQFNNRSAKYITYLLLISLAFIFPLKFESKQETAINSDIWQELQIDEIDNLVNEGNIIFVDVTADWCLTCKVNKFLVLDNKEIIKLFKEHNVIAMRGDWTNKNSEIADYLKKYDRAGIPFNIIYSPSNPDGIIMSELLDKQDIVNSIKKQKVK